MVQADSLTKIIAIVGPTASGKTELSVELAKALNAEIISCDSMQVFREFDIGSAKTTSAEMQGIRHHLIDVVDGGSDFSVSNYIYLARNAIIDIQKRNKVAIIVGGTGLYLSCLIKKQSLGSTARNDKIREEYEKIYHDLGAQYLHKLLEEVDEDSAEKLHFNDVKRVIRALEVYRCTGIPLSKQRDNEEYLYDCRVFSTHYPRELLYERINKRVDNMIDLGLEYEVSKLYAKYGKYGNCQAMQGIGYKEMVKYLKGEATLSEAIIEIKQNSRNYAKRQLTWFKHQFDTEYLGYDLPIADKIKIITDNYKG